MQLSPELTLRQVGPHYMIVDTCADNLNLTNVYSLNASAAWLWQQLEGRDFDADTLVALLTSAYDVDPDTARADSLRLLDLWQANGLIQP